MIKKIIYFIENVNERVEIAKRGHMKFKKTYEYAIYTPDFVEEVSNLIQNKNIVNKFEWLPIVRNFFIKFLRLKYFYNINYLFNVYKLSSFRSYIFYKIFFGIIK